MLFTLAAVRGDHVYFPTSASDDVPSPPGNGLIPFRQHGNCEYNDNGIDDLCLFRLARGNVRLFPPPPPSLRLPPPPLPHHPREQNEMLEVVSVNVIVLCAGCFMTDS